MKAVILAGGEGTRLHPLTVITNKHLLPLYDKPVISYAVDKIIAAGIKDIMIIAAPHHISHFEKLFGSGEGSTIVYGIQHEPKGIAHGLKVARDFVGTDDCVLWLGDGIVEDDISDHLRNFTGGAKVFLKKVPDPARFGVAMVDVADKTGKHLKVREIIEKPANPQSDLAVIGVYIYDNSVWKKMEGQPVSARGEYEITYLNNKYIDEGKLAAVMLEKPWFDVGTFESLYTAGSYMRDKKMNGGKGGDKKK